MGRFLSGATRKTRAPAVNLPIKRLCGCGRSAVAGADMAAIASIGCANPTNGQKLTTRVWACPGSFGIGAKPAASALTAGRYALICRPYTGSHVN